VAEGHRVWLHDRLPDGRWQVSVADGHRLDARAAPRDGATPALPDDAPRATRTTTVRAVLRAVAVGAGAAVMLLAGPPAGAAAASSTVAAWSVAGWAPVLAVVAASAVAAVGVSAVVRAIRATSGDTTGGGGRFALSPRVIMAFTAAWLALEVLVSNLPQLRGHLPEPFDLFSHAKNLKGGAIVAIAAVYGRRAVEIIRSGTDHLTREQLRSFHHRWVPAVVAAATAVNAVTETRWGLTLLGHRLFPETTPDALDLLYSVGFGALMAALAWRPAPEPVNRWTSGPQPEVGKDVLGPAIRHAEAELTKVIRAMPLSAHDRRTARRALKQGMDHYWGRWGLTLKNVHVSYAVRDLVRRLAVAAHLAGRPLPEPELIGLATRLLHWSTATAPYRDRRTDDGRRPAVDVGAPVRDAVTAAFARLLPEPLRETLELDRYHLHEIRVNLLALDDRLYDELVERSRRNAADPDPGSSDGGGPVAVGGMDSRVRGEVIARVPAALPGARLLSREEFPHLARGPPQGVALVRITEDDLGDGGSLLAFGWRDAQRVPAGVILVPARVALIVEQLIAADPAFADWWARLLRHELAFHINGTEHTGQHHDGHAAALAREYDAR
jgi:hypothetical protein